MKVLISRDGELALHDVANIDSFVGLCLTDAIRTNKSRLSDEQRDDAHGYLLEVVLRENHKWDSNKIPDFSQWVREVVRRRYIDWLRKEIGDSRYKTKRPELVSLGDWEEDLEEADFSDEVDTRLTINGAFSELSTKAKWTLENLAFPHYIDKVTITSLAELHGKSNKWVRDSIALLREELEDQGVAAWL